MPMACLNYTGVGQNSFLNNLFVAMSIAFVSQYYSIDEK